MRPDDDPFFRALADATRRRLLFLLWQAGELCVCELAAAVGLSQPKVSRHLAYLRAAGLVSDRRQGQWVFYRLHAGLAPWAREVLAAAHGAARRTPPYAGDEAALPAMGVRPGGSPCC